MAAGIDRASPGRPRLPGTAHAIYAATRSLLAEDGYDHLTIEAVARRAGVGRPTVYRRHRSKASLVAAALVETLDDVNPVDPASGDVARDLQLLLTNLAEALTTDFGRAMTEIVSPACRDPDLAELFDEAALRRRSVIGSVLERAQAERRLHAADPETAIDMALGAIYYRHLISHQPISESFVDSVVASIVTRLPD